MARKPRSKGKGLETPESPSGTTGHGLERQGEEGRLRGLVRYPPGTNGGVHRGPDRYPRVTQAQFMKALAQSQFRKVKVNGKTKTVVVEMAMNADLVRMMQLIAERASRGVGLKYGLKLLEIEEKTFRPLPHEKTEHQAPRPATFVRAGAPVEEPPAEEPAAPATTGLVGTDGQEYAL